MQNTKLSSKLFLLSIFCGAVVMAMSACSSDATQHSQTAAQVAQSEKAKPADGWITPRQKHSNSGIAMRYRMEGELKVGQPVTLHFEFAGARTQDARVSMSMPKALAVGAGAGMQKTGDSYMKPLVVADMSAQSITVTPMSEGAHFINIQLAQGGNSSAAGVMLRVGEAGQKMETIGEAVTTPEGEKLIVMPAK
jgi:hypothetical protein